ncbi:hypothetical protein [Aquamicrobium soli]|uniref:Uncharacterized protein n=1 Tax=Aquamicrobium soli TaxID=1811518 RepID=A0ABV7K8E1_9HYPH
MLQDPRSKLQSIREQLGLTGKELFDRDMQDCMACYLLGQHGIDK